MTQRGLPGHRFASRLGYLLLLAASAAGAWAIAGTLVHGHIHAGTTQQVPWGIWIAAYIYLLGLSVGAFLCSTLIYVFRVERMKGAGPLALVQSLVCLALAGLLIQLDLGHPERFYKVLTSFSPTSMMAWMGVLYGAYGLVLVVMLALALRVRCAERASGQERPLWLCRAFGRRLMGPQSVSWSLGWLKKLAIVGIPIGVLALSGEGAVFAVAKARPNWFGGLLPVMVLVSALASGGALLTVLMATLSREPLDRKAADVRFLARFTVGVLLLELLLLASEILTTLYGGMPHETNAWLLILFGPYWWVFWVLQLGVGVAVPALLVILPATARRVGWLGLAGGLVLAGLVGTRFNLIIPAQVQPAYPWSEQVHFHARYAPGYLPTLHEWLVVAGVVALGVWMLLLAHRLLPLDVTVHEPVQGRGKAA